MLTDSQKYRLLRRIPRIFLTAAICVSLMAVGVVILFAVNRFSLALEPKGERETVISVGEAYQDPGVSAKLTGSLFFRDGFMLEIPVNVQGCVDSASVGTFRIDYSANFLGLKAEAGRLIHVVDTAPPEITLHTIPGHATVYGEPYIEEGYTAIDNVDGDITEWVRREEKDGFVYYRVEDLSGNSTCVSRKIRYYDPVVPVITLMGDAVMHMEAGSSYQEPGFYAEDNVDGDLTDRVKVEGEVDPYLAGSFSVTYSVSDGAGNKAEKVRTVIVTPKAQTQTVVPAGKVIYLTFDDGPGPWTNKLLDVLKKYDVKATFFVINSGYPDVLKRIVSEGHAIGVHSVTHDYSTIYESPEAFFDDLLSMQRLIEEYTGVTTTLMRFPGGSSNTVSCFSPGIMTYLTQAVEDMGFQYFDWNVDSNDAGGARKAETVFKNVCQGVQRQRISVVLQHDIKEFSVQAVERIIQWGLENGYTFLPLSPDSPGAHHGVNN